MLEGEPRRRPKSHGAAPSQPLESLGRFNDLGVEPLDLAIFDRMAAPPPLVLQQPLNGKLIR